MQIHKLISVMIFSAAVLATHRGGAQVPLPPPPAIAQPPSSATRDIETDIAQMTKRYDLTDDQAAKVRAILREQTKKSQEALKDESLSFVRRVDRLKSLKEEEISRVSDVLTPEQREVSKGCSAHSAGGKSDPGRSIGIAEVVKYLRE
jgi:Spy/CpxP family protein refolding chaperone